MILEGIVTTLSHGVVLNIAPMGPRIDPDLNMARFVLRPFRTSTTYQNLKGRGEGVFHVTDDVLLLAQTAIGAAPSQRPRRGRPTSSPARSCSTPAAIYEFRVVELDDREERTAIVVETVAQGRLRDFFGFNRAKHAVVEAAILATRTAWLPLGRDARRVPQARGSCRQDRRPARARGLHPLAPACARVRASARIRPRPEYRAAMTMTRTAHAHSNPEPLALWPAGLGHPGRPAVRRHRADDRLAGDRIDRRARVVLDGSRARTPSRIDQLVDHLRTTMGEAGMTVPPAHIRVVSVPRNTSAWASAPSFAWPSPARSAGSLA